MGGYPYALFIIHFYRTVHELNPPATGVPRHRRAPILQAEGPPMSRRRSRQQGRPVEAVLDAQGDLKLVRSTENGWKILCWILQIRGFLVMSAIRGCSCPRVPGSQLHQGQWNQPMIRWFGAPLGFCMILPRMAPEDFNHLIQSWLVRYSSSHHFHPFPTVFYQIYGTHHHQQGITMELKWLWRPLESLEKS